MRLFKSILQSLYPYGVFRADRELLTPDGRKPLAYLTFDDGPIPEVTPKVLDILAKYNVKATFFMVGENIDKHPEVFRQVVQAGHSIANHTYKHVKGFRYSTKDYLANVAKWEEAYERNMPHGYSAPVTNRFRPPYGRTWWWQRRKLHKLGYRIYLWDVLTRDYNPSRTPEAMLTQIKRQTRPGSIINFHDSVKSNERMLEVLPQAIEWLQKEGYVLRAL